MTNPTETVQSENIVAVPAVEEPHHKPSLKERIVDKLTGHSHDHKEHAHKEGEQAHEEHHNHPDGHPTSFVEGALETSNHPFPSQPMQGFGGKHNAGMAGIPNMVGVPHYDAPGHEREHNHEHKAAHKDHPDAFHEFGDRTVGHDLNSAAAHHMRPLN